MDEIRNLLSYDQSTGHFTWLVTRRGPGAKAGSRAGTQHIKGYRTIKVNQVIYAEHHLAWWFMYGYLPNYIDHIDRDTYNNKISNLREVSRSQNQQNRLVQRNNKLGVKGVWYNERVKRFYTTITINKKVYRANFVSLVEAKVWRAQKEAELHTHRPKELNDIFTLPSR